MLTFQAEGCLEVLVSRRQLELLNGSQTQYLSTMAVKKIFKIFMKAFEGKAQTKFIDVIAKTATVALRFRPMVSLFQIVGFGDKQAPKDIQNFMKAVEGKAWTKFIAVIATIVTVALKVPPNGIPSLD